MTCEYITDKEGYIEYLVNFSKVTSIGKQYRKKFYLGFTCIYILIWMAIFYYVISNAQVPTPYFIMSLIIYVIAVFNMWYFDIHEAGAKRRAYKDIDMQRVILHKKIKITFNIEDLFVKQDQETVVYKIKNVLGFSETNRYIILYISEVKAYVLPKIQIKDEIKKYLEVNLKRIEE